MPDYLDLEAWGCDEDSRLPGKPCMEDLIAAMADNKQRKEALQTLLADPYAAEDLVRSAAWSDFCGGLSAMLSDTEPDTAIAGAEFLDRVLEEARLCDSQSVAELFIALASYISSSSPGRQQDAAGVLTADNSNKSAPEPTACKAGTGLRSAAAIAVDCRAAPHRRHSKSIEQQASATSASAARCNGSSPWPEQSMHASDVATVRPSALFAQQEMVSMHARGMAAQHVIPVSLEQMGEARACQIRLLVKMLEALPKLWVCLKAPMMRKLWRSLSALLLVEPVYDNQQAGHEWLEQAVCDKVDNGSVGPFSRLQAAQRDMTEPECDVQQAVLAAEPADDPKSTNGTSDPHTVQPPLLVEHKSDIQTKQPPPTQLSRIRARMWQRQACSNQFSMPASDMHGMQPLVQSEDLKESTEGTLHASLVQQSAPNGCMAGARSQHECWASGASERQTQTSHEPLQSLSEPACMKTSQIGSSDSTKAQQPVLSGCMTCATSQHGCPAPAVSVQVQHAMATCLQPSSAPAGDLKTFMNRSSGSYTSQQPALQQRDLNFRLTGIHGPLVELSLGQEGSASYGKSWWQAWTLPVSSTRWLPSAVEDSGILPGILTCCHAMAHSSDRCRSAHAVEVLAIQILGTVLSLVHCRRLFPISTDTGTSKTQVTSQKAFSWLIAIASRQCQQTSDIDTAWKMMPAACYACEAIHVCLRSQTAVTELLTQEHV